MQLTDVENFIKKIGNSDISLRELICGIRRPGISNKELTDELKKAAEQSNIESYLGEKGIQGHLNSKVSVSFFSIENNFIEIFFADITMNGTKMPISMRLPLQLNEVKAERVDEVSHQILKVLEEVGVDDPEAEPVNKDEIIEDFESTPVKFIDIGSLNDYILNTSKLISYDLYMEVAQDIRDKLTNQGIAKESISDLVYKIFSTNDFEILNRQLITSVKETSVIKHYAVIFYPGLQPFVIAIPIEFEE